MPFRTLADAGDLKGRRVLLRVDLNVPVHDGAVTDATRIERVAPTIRALSDQGAKVALLAHFERPKGKRVPEMSLKPLQEALSAALKRPVAWADDCIGTEAEAAVSALADGDILLLENTRYHAGEEKNDPAMAAALAKLADAFVNDAFSAAHRAHASTEGVAHLLPSAAGRLLEREVTTLNGILEDPRRPLVAVVGGAKVTDKIGVLEAFLEQADAVLIGGAMCFPFFKAQGHEVGSSLCEEEGLEPAKALLGNAKLSVLLGAFSWDAETRSFGLIVNQAPKPASFTFDYKSSLRNGSTKLGFANGAVTDISHLPPEMPRPDTVPLREQHLKGVVDPLSAIMMLARGSSANPCDRRIPIFDGKERFDLVMSYKGEVKVNEQQPSGQPAIAHVCRVKYRPIAGHKADAESSHLATTDGIEVSLRPIPSATGLVPYQITRPTRLGYATIVSTRVALESPRRPQIALLH